MNKFAVNKDSMLRNLILYIALRSEGDPLFSTLKLNKLLYYIDFFSHLQFGKSITNERYKRLDEGPVPEGMASVFAAMEHSKEIAVRRDGDPFTSCKVFALVYAKVSLFSAEEVDLANRIIDEFRGKTGTEPVGRSYRFGAWTQAFTGEIIPYSTAVISLRDPFLPELRMKETLKSNLAKYFTGITDGTNKT